MPRFARLLPLLTALLATTAAVSAQTPATPADERDDTRSSTVPKRSRAISGDLAASLAASMPKYNPPPKPKPEDSTDEEVDLRDVDKPKNKIIRLPKYVITEQKPAVFRERDLFKSRALTDLAMSRYAGLNFGPFANLNRPVALAMYQEQERLDNIADMKDTARTVGVADKAEADYLRRATSETYLRSDFGYQSGPK